MTDFDNLNYYKLKHAAQLGTNNERAVFDYYENESLRRDGLLYGFYRKKETKPSDYPQF